MIHSRRVSIVFQGMLVLALATMPQVRANPCNPAYVAQDQLVVTVSPTDTDDTANLRCAIDYAATLGSGVTVQLLDHTYKTAQLVVQGFNGTIRGQGQQKTILRNTDSPLPIYNPVTWTDQPPSYANPYPTLISIVGTDVTLSDMGVQVVGLNPIADWYWFGGGPYHFADPAILAQGSNMMLRVKRLEIAGSGKCFPDPAGNVLAGLAFGNIAASSTLPWTSSSQFLVDSSGVRSCVGVYASELSNVALRVTGSRFDTVRRGVIAGGVTNTSIEISSNAINASMNSQDFPVAIDLFGGSFGTGFQNSSILLRSNRISSGLVGIFLENNTVFGAIECAMVGNNVQDVSEGGIGYWFGAGTYGCTLVGHGKGTVMDETNGAHTIVGVTPHTGNVGEAISILMKGRPVPWRP